MKIINIALVSVVFVFMSNIVIASPEWTHAEQSTWVRFKIHPKQ